MHCGRPRLRRLLLCPPQCYTHPHSPHACHPMPDRLGHPGRHWCRSWMASGVSSLPWVAASLEVLRRKKEEPMTEAGTLSIVQRGTCYQVRYASNKPHDRERLPHTCPTETHLAALL